MNKDSSQRFIFEKASIRGEVIHLNKSYTTILEQNEYPQAIKKILGEALVSCVMLAGSIKFKGEISIQFQGDERLPLLIVQCDHEFHIRACVKHKPIAEVDDESDYFTALLEGTMAITINRYNKTQVYQSIVPIKSVSMAENVMHYLAQSEQIPSKIWLAVSETQASGIMLQLMPEEDSQEEFWSYAVQIGETITKDELLQLDNETILYRLYHEISLRLFAAKPIMFRCSCSKEKMTQVIKNLGESEAQSIIKERNHVEIFCDFCNRHYKFDAIDITMMFRSG